MENKPRRATLTVLAIVVLAACFLDYWQYSRQFYTPGYSSDPTGWMAVALGTGYAPQQYRIGVVQSASWMSQHMHMGMRHAFFLLDLISLASAVFLLYGLLEKSTSYRKASVAVQWFGSAAFVLLVQFYLAWLLWYQRPETLPSALYVALLLWLWTRKGIWIDESTAGRLLTAGMILLLSLAQGLIRADVAFLVNAGAFLVCLTRKGMGLALSRYPALLTSIAGALLAVAIQFYMMKVVYPHATYGDGPIFQLKFNIICPIRWVPFGLFFSPYMWTLIQITRRKFALDAANIALVAGSVLYLGLWMLLGKMDEVRIFLPFAMALVPLTVQLAMRRLEQAAGV